MRLPTTSWVDPIAAGRTWIEIGDAPGLGIALDEKKVEQYRVTA
jgi:L-alanine-DL-glutamate epimerase-like enolase superfamily enzyme